MGRAPDRNETREEGTEFKAGTEQASYKVRRAYFSEGAGADCSKKQSREVVRKLLL